MNSFAPLSQSLVLLLLLSRGAAAYTFYSPILPTVPEISLPNTHVVISQKIYRGMLPLSMDHLKNELITKLGVTDILILDSKWNINVIDEIERLKRLNFARGNPRGFTSSQGDVDLEQEEKTPADEIQREKFRRSEVAEGTGPRFFYFPLNWHDLSPFTEHCKNYLDVLKVLKAVKNGRDRKAFFHCTVGEDRTGVVHGLHSLLDNPGASPQVVFLNQMCPYGYEAGDPQKGRDVNLRIRANLTPFYLKMAYKIRRRAIGWDKLDYSACETDPEQDSGFQLEIYDAKNYLCPPSPLGTLRLRD